MKLFLKSMLSLVVLSVALPFATAQSPAAIDDAVATEVSIAMAAYHHRASGDDQKLYTQTEVDQLVQKAVIDDRIERAIAARKERLAVASDDAQYVDVRVCDGQTCHIERRLRTTECPNGLCPNGACASGQCVDGCNCTQQASYSMPMQYFSSGGCSSGSCSSGSCSSGGCSSCGSSGRRGFFRR